MGTRRTELVNWYLNEVESEIESEQELMERKTLVEKVIYRLVHHVSSYLWSRDQTRDPLMCNIFAWLLFQDHVLIQLDHTAGLKQKGEEGLTRDDDPVLVVHPNYVIDS